MDRLSQIAEEDYDPTIRGSAPNTRRIVSTLVRRDIGATHVSVKDLIDAEMIHAGDEVTFKDKFGNLMYKDMEFTSLSKWAKFVASALGLTKHYNGWKVALLKRTLRPLGQYRERYCAMLTGLPYEFPPLEPRKRKGSPSSGEFSGRKPSFEDPMQHRQGSPNGTTSPGGTESDTSSQHEEPITTHYDPAVAATVFPTLESKVSPARRVDQKDDEEYKIDSAEPGSSETDPINFEAHCGQPRCYVCEHLDSNFASQFPTWADILQIALYSLSQIKNNEKIFFSLGEEIYPFVDRHWYKLCSKPRNSSWRQTAKMTLAHSRYSELFENGYDTLMKTGFWRLKQNSKTVMDNLNHFISNRGESYSTPHYSSSVPNSPHNIHRDVKQNAGSTPSSLAGSRTEPRFSAKEDISWLAALADASNTAEEDVINSLSSIGGKRKSPDSGSGDLDQFKSQFQAERKARINSTHRTLPDANQADPTHQLRKEYLALESKYKALELQHNNTLAQLEKMQNLILATRQHSETSRMTFAHQTEMQDGQVRMLLDKIHRLEAELQQRNPTNLPQTSSLGSMNLMPSSLLAGIYPAYNPWLMTNPLNNWNIQDPSVLLASKIQSQPALFKTPESNTNSAATSPLSTLTPASSTGSTPTNSTTHSTNADFASPPASAPSIPLVASS